MTNFTLPTVGTPSTEKPDARTINDGGTDVMRQVVVLGDPDAPLGVLPIKATMPEESDNYIPVRQLAPQVFRCSFTDAVTNGVDADLFDLLKKGSGMTVNQTAGNLVITTGTTVNSETIIRSKRSFSGAFIAKYLAQLSQRIVNQNFYIEFVDKVGDNLAYSINSATSVTVTFPAGTNPFTAANVGQFMNLGNVTGAAGIPGRYAIASVAGDTVTFTVASWPATGTGTLNLFGWNFYRFYYKGTSATAVNFDSQRNGYASGDSTLGINTAATLTNMVQMRTSNGQVDVTDKLVASATAFATTLRGTRDINIPDVDIPLFLQIRVQNGTVAPASTTTLTIGTVNVEDYTPSYMEIATIRQQSTQNALPVNIISPSAIPVTQSGNWFVWSANSYNTDSTTPLGSGATFTGTSRDNGLTPFIKEHTANVYTDQAGLMRWEKSTNNTNWYPATPDTAVAANTPTTLTHTVTTRYSRLVYINGGVAQTLMQLTSSSYRF